MSWDWGIGSSQKPVCEEDFRGLAEAIRKHSDWERAHPHGLDAENPHVVHPRTRDRLIRDGGGYAMCGICGLCYIDLA